MIAFMRDKTHHEIDQYSYERYEEVRQMLDKKRQVARINIGGTDCTLSQIWFIGG